VVAFGDDDVGGGSCTVHLDGEGDVVRTEQLSMEPPEPPAGWEAFGQKLFERWLGPASRLDTDVQLARARFVVQGAAGEVLHRSLVLQRFDPATETFAGSWVTVPVNVTPTSEQAHQVRLAFGRFGGSGAWFDAVWRVDAEGSLQVLRHADVTGFTEVQTCTLAGDVDALLVADVDGDGDDDVVAQLGSELRIFRQGGSGLDCTPTIIALPYSPYRPEVTVVRLDDDDAAGLLVRLSGEERGVVAAVVRGGAVPVLEPLHLDLKLASLTTLPSATNPARIDLAFTFGIGPDPSFHQSDDRAALGLVRQEQGRFLQGRIVDLGAGALPGGERTTGTIQDVDGDGQDDLVIGQTDWAQARMHVLLGPDDGGFASVHTTLLPYPPGLDFVADVTGDGRLDLVILRGNPGQTSETPDSVVLVFPFEGDGFAATPLEIETDFDPRIVVVGQFDDDGLPDLATLHPSAGVVTVLHSNGQGGFDFDVDADRYLVPGQPVTASVLDLDGDGHDDLVVAAPQQGVGPIWLRGRGDGTFDPAVDLPLAANELYVSAAELTGDAFPDLVVLKGDFDSLVTVVLRGRP
jgi:hypothetical protein